jgi:aminoglycoside/choline kinase family phosphotransferase
MGKSMAVAMIPPKTASDFLSRHGWNDAEILPLAGDASFRRYFRIHAGARRAVLMDAPPPHEDPRPFVAIAGWLQEIGLAAPRVLAADLEQGLLLLDDFGDARMRETLDAIPEIERDLYETAVDVLVHLHRQPPMPGLPPHGLNEWLAELRLFPDWYGPAVGLDPIDVDVWDDAWRQVLAPIASDGLAPVTVLRDYHAENVMLIDGRGGIERFGLLDFQDALAGHPAYDLVSVLEDARRDVPPMLERDMIDRYLANSGAGEQFEPAYWALAAQRNTRILGVFTRLWKRDDKPGYRRFQPRMWGLLERDLVQPHLQPVREWFDANIAPEHRREPWRQAA